MNRAEHIHQQFIQRVNGHDFSGLRASELKRYDSGHDGGLLRHQFIDLVETQMMSRLLDIISRRLSAKKQSFYTIGSAGHEANAVFGRVFRINDLAFLHYRSCGFAIQRSKQHPGNTPLYDTLLSFAASSDDPMSGGRHKVIGAKHLWIPPQTSTIASHLPKAVGAAHALGLQQKIPHTNAGLAKDGIVICSFGDASSNHSTAQGAINTAAWTAYQHSPMPIVFICEDNNIGISTPTPKGWIEANFAHRPGLKYIACNGLDLVDCHRAATMAERFVRRYRKPVFLHFKTIRLMGHAGSDVETSYRSAKDISHSESQDPLLSSAYQLIESGIMSAGQIVKMYEGIESRLTRIAEEAVKRPKITSAAHVMDSIWPRSNDTNSDSVDIAPTSTERARIFAKDARHLSKPVHMAKHINLALADLMLQRKNIVLAGEDIANKGGVYGVTQGLLAKFGSRRVTNTLLDEQSILGLSIGLAHCGYLPIPEIQYLAYVHNAEDQIRGEAASLSFFSQGQFTNPMVIRIAGLAYQKGFGGHFHNDNGLAVFRDIPGIVLACPSNGEDAARMLRTCVELAARENKVVIFLEPIALYMTQDLHQQNDGLWSCQYHNPLEQDLLAYGDVNISLPATPYAQKTENEITILTYGNGNYLSHKARKVLSEQHKVNVSIVDIRWLHPLPISQIMQAIANAPHILIVDECRQSGSISEALVTIITEQSSHPRHITRLCAQDSFIPLGDAATLVLPDVDSIVAAALCLLQNDTCNKIVKECRAEGSDKPPRTLSSVRSINNTDATAPREKTL